MSNQIKSDDVIFNFFKQICDEKNDEKCVELGNNWIKAMEVNLNKIEKKYKLKNKIVGVLGLAFKSETDDIRDSLSIKLLQLLKSKKIKTLQSDEFYKNKLFSQIKKLYK